MCLDKRVITLIKVMPSDIGVDLEKLREKIERSLPDNVIIRAHDEEPIAFGLKALKLLISIPENISGGTSSIEDLIRSVEGVEEVSVEFISLEH